MDLIRRLGNLLPQVTVLGMRIVMVAWSSLRRHWLGHVGGFVGVKDRFRRSQSICGLSPSMDGSGYSALTGLYTVKADTRFGRDSVGYTY